MDEKNGWVVYAVEHLRDGIEEWAKCFAKKADAMKYINDALERRFGNYNFRLFRLGEEVALEADDVEIPQPPVVTKRYKATE